MADFRIKDFIKGPWSYYAVYDNQRSLPNIMDGLKTSQRKAIYTFYKHNIQNLNVERASSKVSEFTNYIHGDTSMQGVIARLAQNFPGTNNIPLLEGEGQFGSRMNHDPSAPRYIYATLSSNFDMLFDENDMEILDYKIEEGTEVEPKFFLPILPLLLINGSKGVGNGFSTDICSYSVTSIKQCIDEYLIFDSIVSKLQPHFNGWTGSIKKTNDGQITFTGKLEVVNSTTIKITELPVNYDNDSYKENILLPLKNGKQNKSKTKWLVEPGQIKSFINNSTPDKWEWIVTVPRNTTQLPIEVLYEKFGLIEKMTEVLTVWTPNEKLKIYDSVEQILIDWINYRLEFYEKSRLHRISNLQEELSWLELKSWFIVDWNKHNSDWVKLKRPELLKVVQDLYKIDIETTKKLLGMQILNLTLDDVELLNKQIANKQKLKKFYEKTTAKKLFLSDLEGIDL